MEAACLSVIIRIRTKILSIDKISGLEECHVLRYQFGR